MYPFNMKLYIEDLICRLGNSGKYLFATPISLWAMDQSVVHSLAVNPTVGKGFTEKQRALVLRLCTKYQYQLTADLGPEVTLALENPEFKFPLAQPTLQEKSIKVQGNKILVKFPFSEEIVGKIRKFKTDACVHTVNWDGDEKVWQFALEEGNVLWITNNLLSSEFSVDQEFLEFSGQITEILENMEKYIPTVSHENGQYLFKNTHRTVPQPETTNLAETLLLAKHYGISTWDEKVENLIKNANFSPVLTSFLEESISNKPEFDVNENSIDQFTDLFKYNVPALIIIPGYGEFFTLKTWSAWLKSQGFAEKEISVLFRLDNDTGSMFNDLVRQNNLNNPIDENTKIVFISQKIPKPLIKSGIDFKLIVNLGSLSGVHYSVSTFLDGRPDVIRYTDKTKAGYQFGLL
jgi:hypothetical protein